MQRKVLIVLMAAFGAVGCIEEAPDAGTNNTPNNGTLNNGPNNGTPNNGTQNNGTQNNNGVTTNNQTVTVNNQTDCTPTPTEVLRTENAVQCGVIQVDNGCDDFVEIDYGIAFCGPQPCINNLCGCACKIDGQCRSEGARNIDNDCEYCDSAADPDDWTVLEESELCDDGSDCTPVSTCNAEGQCTGAVDCTSYDNPSKCVVGICGERQTCQSGPAPVDTVCDTITKTCLESQLRCTEAGTCMPRILSDFCYVGDTCYGADEQIADSCQICKPATSQTGFQTLTGSESCGDPMTCTPSYCDNSGQCVPDQFASVDGMSCMSGLCMGICDSSGQTTCDTDYYLMYMDMGTGNGNCEINGLCVPHGTRNPSNECQVCRSNLSPMTWSNVDMNAACSGGTCNGSGACTP